MPKWWWIIFAAILGVGSFIRLWRIDAIPPALSWDEVSIGYNAYSILKTGYDEHQKFLPVDAFAGYGDYKPPFSIYLTVPAVALFGLTEFAVRLPSAVFGILGLAAIAWVAYAIFPKKPYMPLLAAGVLALSPWHIQLSRAGFEANIATTLIMFGVAMLLSARQNATWLFIAWLPFVAAMYTFNSARYFAPIFTLGLLPLLWKTIRTHVKIFSAGVLIAGVCLMPLVPHLLSPEARLRFAEVNIFTDASIVTTANRRIAQDTNPIAKIFDNRRLGYARSYLIHFFDNFEPWFLFIRGDGNPKFSLQDVGQLYLIELPLLAVGIFYAFSLNAPIAGVLLFWIIASVIPAAVARETPHALRIENSLPAWSLFIALGIGWVMENMKSNQLRKIIAVLLGSIYAGSFLFFAHNYITHYPVQFSGEWQYGYREAVRALEGTRGQYKKFVLTEAIGRAYMYTLFYTKTDPKDFWRTKKDTFDAAGFYHVYGFGMYEFVEKSPGVFAPDTVYALLAADVPKNAKILRTISLLDGTPVLVLFTI